MSNFLFNMIGNLFFPPQAQCLGCGRLDGIDTKWLCSECLKKLHSGVHCVKNPDWPIDGISKGWFAHYYRKPASNLVRAMKFSSVYQCLPLIIELMEPLVAAINPSDYDCLVPVPLYHSREWERGFNQSELLATEISKKLNLPVNKQLRRCRNTHQQAKLSISKRRKNITNAFIAKDSFKGLRVLLVDDVLTTASTANACAKALREGGAIDVQAITVLGSGYYRTHSKYYFKLNREKVKQG